MRRVILRTLIEMAAVVAVGFAVGLAANAATDSGIALGKDHLRRSRPVAAPPPRSPAIPDLGGKTAPTSAPTPDDKPGEGESLFTFIDHETAVAIFESPGREYDQDIFIDARDEAHFLEGHVPGAYQLDHYRLERYLPELLPVCMNASRIVIYCNGGECEDSQLAAEDLALEGIEPARLLIYEGGIVRWREENLPIETGARQSGQITAGGK